MRLVWSVLSGKIRVYWNKFNISHMFRERRAAREKVDIGWNSRCGASIRILATAVQQQNSRQYDFLVDGISIFSMPHISDLVPVVEIEDAVPSLHPSELRSDGSCEERSDEDVGSSDCDGGDTYQEMDVSMRLSMAGFTPCEPQDEMIVDDLTSLSLNNVLDDLRTRIIDLIPNSEDMVSRAIVQALSVEAAECSQSVRSWDSSCSSESVTPSVMQIEADIIRDTTEWINHNVQCAPRPDVQDQKRAFLQRLMDVVFVHARQERVSLEGATRILGDVATLLDLRLYREVPRDTVILSGLDKHLNENALISTLCAYGELKEVGMAAGHRFGKF